MDFSDMFKYEGGVSTQKDSGDAALFLRKAYALVNSTPNDLGGWSEKGDTFFVRDVDTFASSLIPTFYKHNNWSSFVRQLNFYGFHKVKSDLSINSPLVWEFAHPLFIRGHPELLVDIVKKNSHTNSSGQAGMLFTQNTSLCLSNFFLNYF